MPVTLARHAMATRFEMILEGGDPMALRAAGEEALDEVERLEARLSLFRETSEIAQVNALAARQPVRISPEVFNLLRLARELHQQTGGAFDITVAPLMRCWGFHGAAGHLPSPEALAQARECVGMHHILMDEAEWTIRFDRHGVALDLGAIGKGYALDCVAEILRCAGVTSAFVHAGTSTVLTIGVREDGTPWKTALDNPVWARPKEGNVPQPSDAGQMEHLATITLKDESLSVSGMDQKFFTIEGRTYGHIVDPRTGIPPAEARVSVVVLPSATETDALSTALLVSGVEDADTVFATRPNMRALVATATAEGMGIASQAIDVDPRFRVKSPFEK